MIEPDGGGWDCHVHVFEKSAVARGGHYRPADRSLRQIESVARAHGVRHLVLVQPSVYGTDNSVMLRALALDPGRHRGVAVIDDDATDHELDAMHALGVRGVRFNLVSPVGERTIPRRRLAVLAPRLRQRGWHVQWYVRPCDLPHVAELHRDSGLTCVLDHLAGLGADVAMDDPAWQAAAALAAEGAWLKLSGWYRLGAQAPYTVLLPRTRRLAAIFGTRMVWGSDWPHTMFPPDEMPAYASVWQPVVDALGEDLARAVRCREPAIYR